MERLEKVIQIIISTIIGVVVANIFQTKTIILQFAYTIMAVLVAIVIIEFIFNLFKKE